MTWAQQALEESPPLSRCWQVLYAGNWQKSRTLITKIMYWGAKSHVVRGKVNSESEEQTEVSNREWWGLEQLENPDSVIQRKICSGFLGLIHYRSKALFRMLH